MGGGRAFDAGRRDIPELRNFFAALGQVDDEALGSRDTIVARARHLTRNNPTISGGVDRRTEAVVGSRLMLKARPDFEAMGRTADWAIRWRQRVEAQWRVWVRDSRRLCDAERAQNFGDMISTAYRHWFVDGEALAYVEMHDRGSAYQTCVRLIDPDRLRNPMGVTDNALLENGNTVVGGVEVDGNGVAVAYHVRVDHPSAIGVRGGNLRTVRVAREDADGRPRVVHAYRRTRASQRRGISKLVASMKSIKMLDRYSGAELAAALFRAVQVGVVKTELPTNEIAPALAPTGEDEVFGFGPRAIVDYREQHPLHIEGLNVAHLLPSEEFDVLGGKGPPSTFAEFQSQFLMAIASDLGLSYQQLSQDWASINYSSARTLLNEIWRGLLDDRWQFAQSFCTPIYAAWLQEAVAIGKVKLPGGPASFLSYRAELTMADWLGPGRGRIDPKKEAEASDLNLAAGRTNLQREAAELGEDARDILVGLAEEKAMKEQLGLSDIGPTPPSAGHAEADARLSELEGAEA